MGTRHRDEAQDSPFALHVRASSFFFFSPCYHFRSFPGRCVFIPAIQFSISFGLFNLSCAASPRPRLCSVPGIFLLPNTHVTITFACDRAAVAAASRAALKPRRLGPGQMLRPARAPLGRHSESLCLSLLLCADTFGWRRGEKISQDSDGETPPFSVGAKWGRR